MYRSDDAYNQCPPMEATKVNYEEDKSSPPPFVPKKSDPEIDVELAGPPHKPNEPEPQNSADEGDRVLMRFLAPNQPEVAATARASPLEPLPGKKQKPPPNFGNTPIQSYIKMELPPTRIHGQARSHDQALSNASSKVSSCFHSSNKTFPELKSRLTLPSLQLIQPPHGTILAKHPQSNDNSQPLPSICEALSVLSDFGPPPVNTMSSPYPFSSCPESTTSGNSSSFDRPYPGNYSIPTSPYSQISPLSVKDASTNSPLASRASFWRGYSQFDMMLVQNPYKAPPAPVKIPATGYSTRTEHAGASMGDRVSLASSTSRANEISVGNHQCTIPGCAAEPFKTQYLLNSSHANVHSQDRPYFCPVGGCPRAHGGKGFKRKNEMALGVLGAVLRFTARIRRLGNRNLQVDDYLMMFAMVWYTLLCVALNQVASGGGSNLMTDKDRLHMTPQNKAERVAANGFSSRSWINYIAIYVTIGFVATELSLFLTCRPITQYWAVPTDNYQCPSYQYYEIIQGCISISADIFILLIAIPMLVQVRVPLKQKLILVAIVTAPRLDENLWGTKTSSLLGVGKHVFSLRISFTSVKIGSFYKFLAITALLSSAVLAQDPGPSPSASIGCEPHGDHWHCDGPASTTTALGSSTASEVEATTTSAATSTTSATVTPTLPSPTESVGFEPHKDHWHCDGPVETSSSSASASASAGADDDENGVGARKVEMFLLVGLSVVAAGLDV
ncbi:hypothetical protein PENARI_c086G04173 [Penicillium arizonense]|uniref:Rhodopsin domain-containing protein n=1 Tax=Penicillium arizonense TaxID=1835702 RepID=A0A1F5L1Y4_PENAI|nr:hypothetical protein PENARI_c086G04173 [Penicillium arizonense]OGE46931.1 hypothetical protein PENARI_c086G04173 [Penicillium arizonense]